jgi:phosphate transport system substrate-binding protein
LVGDRVARNWNAASWTLAAVTVVVAGALSVYWEHRPDAAQRGIPGTIEVCAIPGAVQLAHDLIAGFAAKSGLAVQRFSVRNGNVCDVRFSSAAATPDAVIARDGIVAIVNPLNSIPRISERQLHDVFSGTIRDWAQLGGRPGKIVALLPEDSSDEAQAIASSILLGVKVDPGLRREASSADVTRVVAGAGQTSRRAIGLVAFSQSIPAKVLPLAYLPPPSVLSIGTRHYPYTMTIAVEIGSQRADSDARRLVDFATSNDGAQVVAKDGLVGRGDL